MRLVVSLCQLTKQAPGFPIADLFQDHNGANGEKVFRRNGPSAKGFEDLLQTPLAGAQQSRRCASRSTVTRSKGITKRPVGDAMEAVLA